VRALRPLCHRSRGSYPNRRTLLAPTEASECDSAAKRRSSYLNPASSAVNVPRSPRHGKTRRRREAREHDVAAVASRGRLGQARRSRLRGNRYATFGESVSTRCHCFGWQANTANATERRRPETPRHGPRALGRPRVRGTKDIACPTQIPRCRRTCVRDRLPVEQADTSPPLRNPDVTNVQAGSNTAGTDYRRGFSRLRVSLSITNVMANAVTLALVADTASVRPDDRVASRRRSRTPPAPFAGACDNGK
jgi:hypothetical protein